MILLLQHQSTSTIRDDESNFSSILVIMRLQSQILPPLIENYGITLFQWKMGVDTTKIKSILQEIVRDYNEKREDKLSVVLATTFQPVSPQFQVKYTF